MSRPARRLRVSAEVDVTRSLIEAARFAQSLGLGKQECQSVSTAVSELARNILKYAGEGFVALEEVEDAGRRGIQVTVQDHGPGIPDVEEAMRDHVSSGGTLGLGLPGVRRLMDDFELVSSPGAGTRVVIRKWVDGGPAASRSLARGAGQGSRPATSLLGGIGVGEAFVERSFGNLECAYFVRPFRGERVSGDLAVVEEREGQVLLAVVDALGHGPAASRIAIAAGRFLAASWSTDPKQTILELHQSLDGTDGAAVGLCVIDTQSGAMQCLSVGNTVIRMVGGTEKRAFSTPGTVGYQIRTPRVQHFTLGSHDMLLIHSDGLKESFDLTDHPEVLSRNPGQMCREIVTRFGKDHDDVSCLVARYAR